LYDPFNTPHARGDLKLGLQTSANANYGAAVVSGQLAYFVSGNAGRTKKCSKIKYSLIDASFYAYNAAMNTTQTLVLFMASTKYN
jgi:hypothetical protein